MDLDRQFNILIVDNNRTDRETYRRYLLQETAYTYKILAATTGEKGLELYLRHKPDGILLNSTLPGIDGLKFLQQLKAASHSSALPAVVMAGREDKAIAKQALAFGVEEYIVKNRINAKQLRLAMRCAIENRRLRAQLVAVENRFRTSAENLFECLGIYSAIRDKTGAIADFRIDYVNTAACATNRMTQAEQIGKRLCELLPNHRESGLFAEYCQVVETGKPLLKESYLYIDIFSSQTLVRFFDIRVTKLGDGFVASWRDVTEKKQAEAHKVLLEQASLLEQVHEAILIRDANNAITSWNRAAEKMYGWTRDEARGNVAPALLKTQLPPECHNLEAILWQEGHWNGELSHTRKDGTQIVVESRQVVVRDRQGIPVGILEVNRDITDRKRQEALLQQKNQELEQASRVKDEFVAIVSHELRSPLNPILGWSKLLQSGKLDAAKTAEALAIIERNAKLQAQLIDDLLDVSRIMRGKLSLNVVSVNLAAIVKAALETVQLAAGAKSIELRTVLESNIGRIEGDPNRLQQIVWNLLSNAVKFTPDGGRVEISLKQIGSREQGAEGENNTRHSPLATSDRAPLTSYAQLQVTDTGKGISPEFLPYVFDSFRQENTNLTTRHGGLGLGLAIVKELVELHGGTIDVESLGEGQGTTFTLMLPLHTTSPDQ